MNGKANLALVSTLLLGACATCSLARAPLDHAMADPRYAVENFFAAGSGDAHMVTVRGKDVSGEVFKRLGLPNQDYCWQQCLQEERCTGTRWGAIAGTTAGQCQLISGALTFGELRDIRTEDGKKIQVIASRKEGGAPKGVAGKSGA